MNRSRIAKPDEPGSPQPGGPDPLEVSSLAPEVRLATDERGPTSTRKALIRLSGLFLAVALLAAAVAVPLAISHPAQVSSLPLAAAASADETREPTAVITDSGTAPSVEASVTAPDEASPTAPSAPRMTDRVGDTGGSTWYKDWNITYTKSLKGGQTGSLVLSNHGKGQCQGDMRYAHGDITDAWVAGDGSPAEDPWHAEFTTYETYQGSIDLVLICHSDGFDSGYVHNFHLPIQVAPADPWTMQVAMDGYIGEGLSIAFTVTDPNYTTNQGGCTLTSNVPGQGQIVNKDVYWRSGVRMQPWMPIASIPWDTPPGTVTWTMSCTDMNSVGYTTTFSVSGTYQLRLRVPPATPTDTAPPPTTQSPTAPPTVTAAPPTEPPTVTAAPPTAPPAPDQTEGPVSS